MSDVSGMTALAHHYCYAFLQTFRGRPYFLGGGGKFLRKFGPGVGQIFLGGGNFLGHRPRDGFNQALSINTADAL